MAKSQSWEKSGRGKVARSILRELAVLLKALLQKDEPSHIDLSSMELDEDDYTLLHETLGEGEIVAQVESLGRVDVLETGYAGIWWVTHRDAEGHMISEFLEISYCPEVLIAEVETVADGHNALKARLFEMGIEDKRG